MFILPLLPALVGAIFAMPSAEPALGLAAAKLHKKFEQIVYRSHIAPFPINPLYHSFADRHWRCYQLRARHTGPQQPGWPRHGSWCTAVAAAAVAGAEEFPFSFVVNQSVRDPNWQICILWKKYKHILDRQLMGRDFPLSGEEVDFYFTNGFTFCCSRRISS